MNHTDVSSIIISGLKEIFIGDYTDVPKVHLYRHYIENILITLLNAKRLGILENDHEGYLIALDQMSSFGILSNDVPAFWREHERVIRNALPCINSSDWNNPHSIHEELLGRELNISQNDLWFSSGKISRDTTGSYYTPSDLATAVVREAIEKYLNIHTISTESDAIRLLGKVNFADFSCGCGEFIKAILKYLQERYGITPQNICMNLYGIDIDPIALQITICDLLEIADKNNWRDIISHFVLGNPLIDQPDEKDILIKTRLFASKRYYADDMGLDMRHLFGNTSIDIVVGNPPWEKVRFEERKFFKAVAPEISDISQKNKRKTAIQKLKKLIPTCYDWYQQIANDYVRFKNKATKHPHISKTLNGELNTYALFTELSSNLIAEDGILSLIVKSAIVTSPANKPFFSYMANNKKLVSVCLYDNSLKIFSIDSREKFCVITCTKKQNKVFELIAGAKRVEDLHSLERGSLTAEEINIINPNTQMIPNISSNNEMTVLLDAHRRLPLFDTVYPECHFGRLVHLTTHASNIDTKSTDSNLPIYEGKFIERYDARFATFAGLSDTQKYSAKAHAAKNIFVDGRKPLPQSRYYIKKEFWEKLSTNYAEPYMLCWRSLTSNTNTRTTLAMLLPTMPTCQSIQFLQKSSTKDLFLLLALFNSKPFDYFVRLKMPGIDLTQSVIRQVPVPCRVVYQQQLQYAGISATLEEHIFNRIAVILSREPLVLPLLKEQEPPSASVQKKQPSILEKEIDDLLFIAYGLSKSEIKTIQSSFKS